MGDVANVRMELTRHLDMHWSMETLCVSPGDQKSDASTLTAVENLKKAMPKLRDQLPDDVKVSYEFDQSKYIERSLSIYNS